LDVTVEDVCAVYNGPGGILWELLMGEQIHVGGAIETDRLARKAGVTSESHVLDVCSALGGPARHLARNYGCRVTGLDVTRRMQQEAVRRTEKANLSDLVSFHFGNALDLPFSTGRFDVVWGQDAWCYVTDKARLIQECSRVIKPGGVVAFTDWLQTGSMTEEEWQSLLAFMVFPYMETLDGYVSLVEDAGLTVEEQEDLSEDFAARTDIYLQHLREQHRKRIVTAYGEEMYREALAGITLWRDAAAAGKVGRGRVIARKKFTS
jgi:ubiquinone/menaquinone biosynthesis C-methylase UbiE